MRPWMIGVKPAVVDGDMLRCADWESIERPLENLNPKRRRPSVPLFTPHAYTTLISTTRTLSDFHVCVVQIGVYKCVTETKPLARQGRRQ